MCRVTELLGVARARRGQHSCWATPPGRRSSAADRGKARRLGGSSLGEGQRLVENGALRTRRRCRPPKRRARPDSRAVGVADEEQVAGAAVAADDARRRRAGCTRWARARGGVPEPTSTPSMKRRTVVPSKVPAAWCHVARSTLGASGAGDEVLRPVADVEGQVRRCQVCMRPVRAAAQQPLAPLPTTYLCTGRASSLSPPDPGRDRDVGGLETRWSPGSAPCRLPPKLSAAESATTRGSRPGPDRRGRPELPGVPFVASARTQSARMTCPEPSFIGHQPTRAGSQSAAPAGGEDGAGRAGR